MVRGIGLGFLAMVICVLAAFFLTYLYSIEIIVLATLVGALVSIGFIIGAIWGLVVSDDK